MKLSEFKHPGKEYRPSPFWSWNDLLIPEELRWQVRQMAEKGFGGYFMHSRVGLATEYLSEEWMECIGACLDEGKRVEAESWLYDEDKWPSGFAGGIVPALGDIYRARALVIEEVDDTKSLADEGVLRGFAVRLSEKGLEAFRIAHPQSKINDGERVFAFREQLQPKSNWYNGESYADLLNPMVTKKFLDVTLPPYIRSFQGDFGEFMPGVFTDEPQYYVGGNLPWTGTVCEYFQKLNGYDILDVLPLLFFEGEGYQKVRYDFWRTVTKLFVEAFSKPFYERCEELGLMLTGHYMAEDNLVYQMHFIGAAMPHYEFMQCPGIDHLGRNIDNPLTLKQCSSVAHQFGRKRILCEIFGVSGHSMSFEDQKWIADFHFALGITFLCQHLTLYTMKGEQKRDYPPTISYHQPYWEDYKLANDYFARAGYLCSQGNFAADILLLHSMGSAWATYAPSSQNEQANAYNRGLTELLDDMLAIHRDVDLGDEMILSNHARVEGEKVIVAKEGKYRLIVVPPSLTWNWKTVDVLKDCIAANIPVVFVGETPTLIDGEPAEEKWESLIEKATKVDAHNRAAIEKTLDNLLPRDVSVTDADGNEIGDIYVHHRIDGAKHIYFLSNKSRTDTYIANATFAATGEVTEWLMDTGEVTKDVSSEIVDGYTSIELAFPPVGSHAITIDTNARNDSPTLECGERRSGSSEAISPQTAEEPSEMQVIKLSDRWDFERLHPNSLTLDTCQYCLGDGDWSEKTPIWKARRAAWNAAGLEAYAGIQPWVLQKKQIEPTTALKLRLRTTFESEVIGKSVCLVLESATDYTLLVNGQNVSTETTLGLSSEAYRNQWHWDKQFSNIDISSLLKKGENTIELSCQYGMGIQVEDMYLVGDFGVRKISGDKYILTDEPAILKDGDWGEQGYPFYVGSVCYNGKFNLQPQKEKKVFLRLKNPKGCLFKISVNGKEPVPLWFQPWQVDITDLVRDGENTVSIEVVSTLRNTFGPLHHKAGDALQWVGPGQFVDEANWMDDYQLVPYGLLDGVEVILT